MALKTDLGVAGSSGKSASGFTTAIASERALIYENPNDIAASPACLELIG